MAASTTSAGALRTQCVFPERTDPHVAWSTPAKSLLRIFRSRMWVNLFSDSSENEILTDYKGAAASRLDNKHALGYLTAYYFADHTPRQSVSHGTGRRMYPGFNAISEGRAQLINLGLTRAWGRQHGERSALQLSA